MPGLYNRIGFVSKVQVYPVLPVFASGTEGCGFEPRRECLV